MASALKTDVRNKVKKYIDTADDTTVKMIYAMLKVQKAQALAEDKFEIDEIHRRIEEYEQGKVKPLTLTFDQLADSVREKYIKNFPQNNE